MGFYPETVRVFVKSPRLRISLIYASPSQPGWSHGVTGALSTRWPENHLLSGWCCPVPGNSGAPQTCNIRREKETQIEGSRAQGISSKAWAGTRLYVLAGLRAAWFSGVTHAALLPVSSSTCHTGVYFAFGNKVILFALRDQYLQKRPRIEADTWIFHSL